jgi:hypothetical protein
MSNKRQQMRSLLEKIGIDIEGYIDDHNETLIVIKTASFNLHRSGIERWFTLVDQRGNYTYLRERLFGNNTSAQNP